MTFKFLEFEQKISDSGILVPIENFKQIPFGIKRIFYIYNIQNNKERGNHGHINLQEIILPIQGSCTIIVHNGKHEQEYKLDKPNKGLHLYGLFWLKMKDFSPNCILLVLCSEVFRQEDNINDYDTFMKLTNFN
jgi:hypothetical protein